MTPCGKASSGYFPTAAETPQWNSPAVSRTANQLTNGTAMTHTSRNSNARTPASSDVRAITAFLLAGLVGWLGPAALRAGDNAPGPLLSPPSRKSIKNDLATAIQVKRALERDEQLAPQKLNLYVKVTSGIARLSGPVPSEEVRKRVVAAVAQVPGVLQVQSTDLYLAKPLETTRPPVLPSADEKPTRTQSASPNSASAALGTLTGRESAAAILPRITLMAPEAVSPTSPKPKPAVLTAQSRPPISPTSLAAAIEDLRRRDARFRALRTEVQGKTVCLFAGNAEGESVMVFAQALTRLPGVERVVVRDPSSSPTR